MPRLIHRAWSYQGSAMNQEKEQFVTDELNQLQKEIISKNPVDILQFCFNYFNSKLQLQRSYLYQHQVKAELIGLNLFPNIDNVNIINNNVVNGRQPSFKSPFNLENDPHAVGEVLDPGAKSSPPPSEDSTSAPNFGSFGSFSSTGVTRNVEEEEGDPMAIDTTNAKRPKPKPLTTTKIPTNFNINRRISVSAEALNPDNFKLDSWTPPTNNLNAAQREDLFKTLCNNFLFQRLDANSQKAVVSALIQKKFTKGSEIIRQGDEGDYFYIIESGLVEFYVDNVERGSANEGSSFGELALMHNSPRAATVVAQSDVTCWALDRLTFRRILLEGTFNKRLMYENFLKGVKILSSLNNQEISKLADALTTEVYEKGDKIVTQGAKGDNFYFIELGNCEVIKDNQVVNHLTKGDYFGEIALLNDLPRQATVQAADKVIVATLDKSGFQRLLGPAVDILKNEHY